MPERVFISYSRVDGAYVARLAQHLDRAGIPVWYDRDIGVGDRWLRAIQQNIDASAAVVVVMTPASSESPWVERELIHAEGQCKPILPLLLDGTSFLSLNSANYEDVRGGALPGDVFLNRLRGHLGIPIGKPLPLIHHLLWVHGSDANAYEVTTLRASIRVSPKRTAAQALARIHMGEVDAVVYNAVDGVDAARAFVADVNRIDPNLPVYCHVEEPPPPTELEGCGARAVTASGRALLDALQRQQTQALTHSVIAKMRAAPGIERVEYGEESTVIARLAGGRRIGVAVAAWFRRPLNRVVERQLDVLTVARDRGEFEDAWFVVSGPPFDHGLRVLATERGVRLSTLDELTVR